MWDAATSPISEVRRISVPEELHPRDHFDVPLMSGTRRTNETLQVREVLRQHDEEQLKLE